MGENWEHYEEYMYPTDVCKRCGVAVSQYHTDNHDKFHAQIDAAIDLITVEAARSRKNHMPHNETPTT